MEKKGDKVEAGIQVNKTELVKYLSCVELKGANQNTELMLKISDDGFKSICINPSKSLAIKAILKDKVGEVGEIGVDNLPLLKSVIQAITGDKIALKIKDNKLLIKSNKSKISLVLRSPQYIKNTLDEKTYDGLRVKAMGNPCVLTKEIISTIIQNYNILKPASIKFVGKDNNLTVSMASNDNDIVAEFEVKDKVKPFTVTLGAFFMDILSLCSGDMAFSYNEGNSVVLCIMETDKTSVEYLVAPMKS